MVSDGIASKISQYLATPVPSYALLLSGEWGVGKSFYWRHYRNSSFPAGKRDITFSVAGLMTLEELERALFLASIQDVGPTILKEAGTVVGRAVLRWANVDPKDIKLKAAVKTGKTVICIDDIERFGGSFQTLFGLIVSLLDDAKLHVVLIADEKRAIKELQGYAEYKERIISRSLAVPPAVAALYKDVVSGFLHVKTREALLARQDDFVQLFEEKKLKNLRTIRSILDELNTLLSVIDWSDATPPALDGLVTAITFSAIVQSKDPGNRDLVRQAFLQEDLGMALALYGMEKDEPGKAQSERPLPRLINDLGFENEASSWPLARNFAAYMAGETYSPHAIAAEFKLFTMADKSVPVLDRFRDYRSMEESQFRATLDELLQLINERQLDSVQEIWTAFQLLYHMSELRLSGLTTNECVQVFLELIAAYSISLTLKPGLEIWPGTAEVGTESVLTALEELESKVSLRVQAESEAALRDYLFTGSGVDPHQVSLAPLTDQDPSALYSRLKSAGREAVLRIGKFYQRRLRVSNISEYAWKESSVAFALAELIEKDLAGYEMFTLDQAALKDLSTVLSKYAAAVGSGKPQHD